jgi:hypothetical protein
MTSGASDIHQLDGSYSIASLMKARNRLAYWSGSTVEIPSTLAPYFTVFAAYMPGYNFRQRGN